MAKVDFFISYTKVDEDWAKWIAWELKKQRFTCIIQAWDFNPGSSFIEQMSTAIDKSKQIIAVLSPEYLNSEYATAERNAALAIDPLGVKGKLVPVRIR
ncbi:MAG TPA: toll/interleukin-1 receptor domain-containing protein, partial [Pyrinomonadaceae bacterium]|nr:toll/interleukin-1 receptor domain-containing protein [Pyrinomonadaceae bacterium]